MLPYLIAGAIGFGIAKLFEEGGETFGRGGKADNTFVNVLLDYGFIETRGHYGIRNFRHNSNGYFAFVDMKNKNVEVFKDAIEGTNYSGFSIQELIDFLNRNGFKSNYAGGGGVEGIKKKAEKLLEDSISYRWVNTDMGSGWSFELESPSDRSVFNILEEHTYLDEFSPEDAGFEDWDNLSEEDKDYYYQEWKEEFYQGAFERFKEKCMKHLDDFIEYLQRDSDENFAGGGGVGKSWTIRDNDDLPVASYLNESQLIKWAKQLAKENSENVKINSLQEAIIYIEKRDKNDEQDFEVYENYANGGNVIFQVGDMVKIMPNYPSHYTNSKGEIVKIMPDNKTYEVKIKHKTGNEYVKFDISELVFLGNEPKYAGGGGVGAESKSKIKIIENKKEGKKTATQTLVKENNKGEKITYELSAGMHTTRKENRYADGWFEIYATDENDDEYFYSEGGLWIENGRIYDYDGVYELSEKLKPLLSALNLNSEDVFSEGGVAKKRRRSPSVQYGGSDILVDKQRSAKPVGYRFTDTFAKKKRRVNHAIPKKEEIKQFLGKGIYKESRRNRSDISRKVKL
jgi:hypothetical protein